MCEKNKRSNCRETLLTVRVPPVLRTEMRWTNQVLRLWLPPTNAQGVMETSMNLLDWTPFFSYSPLDPAPCFELRITNATQRFFRTRIAP